MTTISIYIKFKGKEEIMMHSGAYRSHIVSWNLSSNCLSGQNKLQWQEYIGEYTMHSKEFLRLVGATKKEAKKIVLQNYSYLDKETVKKHITNEVKEFYKELKINELKYVKFRMMD